ncbi:MAG: methyl-accepting chemotaxis protein [Azonexus sp.]|nr:methyl-accepting chemotaxis protein [Azonexus sp.]
MNINLLSIRSRLLMMVGAGAVFGLILLLTAVFSLNSFRNDIRQISHGVEHSSRALTLVSGAQSAFQGQLRGLKNMLIRNFMPEEFTKAKNEFISERDRFWKQLDELEKLNQSNPAQGSTNLPEVRKQALELNTLYDQVLAENEAGMAKYTVMVDAALRGADRNLTESLAKAYREISDATNKVVSDASLLADMRFEEIFILLLIVGIGGSIITVTLATYVSQRILARLGGDLEPVLEVTRRVASGDLTGKIVTGKAAADSLVASIEAMQQRLRVLISEVKAGAEKTSGNADSLSKSAGKVAQAASDQSEAAALITAAIEELTVAITMMAESAGSAADASRTTRDKANESGAIIHQAIAEIGNISLQARASADAMGELNQHTQEISRFAQEIKEISEQTNLLSLNAAIEAARAGESGRGFAVVADEVRKLANHTAETTHKIEGLVSKLDSAAQQTATAVAATAERAQRGTALASSASSAIVSIEENCERSMHAASDIVSVLAEQRQAAEQIAQNTERVAQMIERGAAAATESSATASEVALLAGRLREATLQFSV